ncbi:MAG: tetratricopeptide repeat protein, partial [Acidobacteriota bacterium]
ALREEEAGLGDADRQALRRTLAMTFLNLARYDEVTRLLESDPSRPETPALEFTYALALVRSGRAAQAGPIFDRLLASGSAWPALHVLLGQARAQEGDFEAAEAALRHALTLDPQVAEAHSTLGDLMMRQGRLEEAESALRAELKAHPEDRDARYLLATVLDLHRKPRAAEAELRLLLDRSPRHGGARYLLGKVLLSGGDAASALEQLEAAVAITPQDEGAHYQLGLAYQRSGRAEDASRHFARFRELKAAGREPAP